MKTLHVRIEGKVQNVFFREYTKRKAVELNLKGWVRNNIDGSVESHLYGDEQSLARIVSWFHQGSPQAIVTKVQVEESKESIEENSFRIVF